MEARFPLSFINSSISFLCRYGIENGPERRASGMHLVQKWLVMANKEDSMTLQMTGNVTGALDRSQAPDFTDLSGLIKWNY